MYRYSMHQLQLNTNEKLRFIFQMKYGKHLISTVGNDQINTYFIHFAGHLTCSDNFRGYKRPRKLKTANIYPHVLEKKTQKFGDAKIFHFTVILSKKWITKALIRLCRCAGRSAPVLFANPRRQVFLGWGPYMITDTHNSLLHHRHVSPWWGCKMRKRNYGFLEKKAQKEVRQIRGQVSSGSHTWVWKSRTISLFTYSRDF